MLVELFIKNFVLIKDVSIKLSNGLIAFTDESGGYKIYYCHQFIICLVAELKVI